MYVIVPDLLSCVQMRGPPCVEGNPKSVSNCAGSQAVQCCMWFHCVVNGLRHYYRLPRGPCHPTCWSSSNVTEIAPRQFWSSNIRQTRWVHIIGCVWPAWQGRTLINVHIIVRQGGIVYVWPAWEAYLRQYSYHRRTWWYCSPCSTAVASKIHTYNHLHAACLHQACTAIKFLLRGRVATVTKLLQLPCECNRGGDTPSYIVSVTETPIMTWS